MSAYEQNKQFNGPKAPKDARKKRPGFHIMRGKQVMGSPQPDGRGIQFLYQDDGRMISSARIVGNVTDEEIFGLMKTVEGFRKLVYSIGVSVETDGEPEEVDFVFQMYGKSDPYRSGTVITRKIRTDGMEEEIVLEEQTWSEDDNVPGQIRFEFPKAGQSAVVAVKLYLQDGYEVPEEAEEHAVDFDSPLYGGMLDKSLMQLGNPARLQKALDKAKAGEDITVAFIGGSITQGAGAIPINTKCYAYQIFEGLCAYLGIGTDGNIHYRKAGVGGTPSELGMIRYERDVLRMQDDGKITEDLPDIVVVEFAVNDEGDETKGECYDSLVRKILMTENAPAVILLFAVFADDGNLQERLSPVGRAYDLPMVSVKDAVVEQFYQKGADRMVSKNQFFYDCYHPTNVGHRIMADCVLHCIREADAKERQEDTLCLEQIKSPKGNAFERVSPLDRNIYQLVQAGKGADDVDISLPQVRIDCGDFTETDEELQAVEMDMNLVPTKEFPYNWMYTGGRSQNESPAPFAMDIVCKSLLIVFKDSADIGVGCAEVWADGEKVLFADPHINGWTHCNAAICFRDKELKSHHVEVRMAEGQADKKFTILGFGYVE